MSVIAVVAGRFTYLGIKMNMIINITGTTKPNIEYTSGLDELRHNRHHSTLKTIARIIMNVPTPIPKILPLEDWQFIHVSKEIVSRSLFRDKDSKGDFVSGLVIEGIFIEFYSCFL